MREHHTYVGAYWGDRAETPNTAAQRLSATVDGLAELGPGFIDWVIGRDQPLPVGSALLEWTAAGFDSERTGRKPSLGAIFTVLSDQGLSGRTLEMRVSCGINAGKPVLTNALVARPRDRDAEEVLPHSVVPFLDAVTSAWEPDWAVVSTGPLRSAAFETLGRRRGPIPGILTWLSGRLVTGQQVGALDKIAVTDQQGGYLLDARAAVDLAGDQAISDLAAEMAAADLFARFPNK